jgi:peptidyl-prolyl cis-trans isomerase C
MFRQFSLATALAVCGIAAHAQQPAAVPESATIIESGNLSITRGEFEKMLAADPRLAKANRDAGGMQALGQAFGRAFALEAEARRRQLDQDPTIQLRIRNYTQQLLAHELLQSLRKQYLREDKQIRAVYEADVAQYAQPRVSQILVRFKGSEVPLRKGQRELSEDQARQKAVALLARLRAGASFEALVKTESDDVGTRGANGDIGFVSKGAMPAEFESAAYALKVGETSGVVRTQYGFHILRVSARQPMAYDTIKAAIANDLAHKELDRLIADGYKLNSAYFGGP